MPILCPSPSPKSAKMNKSLKTIEFVNMTQISRISHPLPCGRHKYMLPEVRGVVK